MADRYTKENILQYPKLQPTRHYESENPTPWQPPARQIPKRDPLLDNLDDLDNLMKICDILPPGLADVIKAMTDVLSKHTQGLIIMRLQKEIHEPKHSPETPPGDHPEPDDPWKYIPQTPEIPPYVPPSTPTPHGMDDDNPHKPGEGERYPDHPKQPDTYEEEHEKHGNNPPDVPEPVGPGKEEWPGTHTEYRNGENNNEKRNIYISDRNDDEQYDVVITDKEPAAVADVEVDDIFSAEPEVEINLLPTDSLVDLARKGYMQDDADIKEHYTTMMTQISQRFYQVMTALAEDGNMLDYSDLMQDFDGTAVTTDDPNQQHLIDEICRNDVLYDQKLRQMNLTHTPEKTLIMTRAMTAAEGERERYLQSDYKTNMPTIVSGLSNDLLQKAREESEKKYKEAAYNMYKFLDSATKYTNTMLNMKIDSAIAKAQLANTGSDIFAITPPPQPLADNTDDNFDTTVKHQETAQKFIDEQKKDSKKASEIDKPGSSTSPGIAVAAVGELGADAPDPKVIWDALHKGGYNDIATAAIMGSMMQESRFSPSADNGSHHGLVQWDTSAGGRWDHLVQYASEHGEDPGDAGTQVEYCIYEACNVRYPEECGPDGMNKYGSVWDASEAWLKWFEGALGQQDQERANFGQGFYEQYAGKK